ncbi:MAG: carbon monoxide dehydrogenase [Actinobacteria bacterium 13_1_20CM_4_68_12]|nr:MAG: carbon monoxide dehydrogenase [Actinobacteria bacterium 13_1_20CM_4_68_12]
MTDLSEVKAGGPAIGTAMPRVEDARLLQGQGQYAADLRGENMLHAVIVRSAVAHGQLRGIDASKAVELPGVRLILTAADVAGASKGTVPKIPMRQDKKVSLDAFLQPVIALDEVRYVGEPVAVVLAETPAQAQDGADAVELDIEPLPAVTDAAAGQRAVTVTAVRGDADAAFASAPYTRKEKLCTHRHTAMPIETRGLLAEWDPAGTRLRLSGAAKVPFMNRGILARLFEMSETDVELVEGDTGGSFGVRGEFYPEDFLVPFAARQARRRVKWIETRGEHFMATNHSREAECELEIACSRDGTILAMRGRGHTDVGAYVRTNGTTPAVNMAQVSSGPYRIPHVRMEVAVMLTNKTPSGTYRAPGRFETDFFRERLFDLAAADLGIDRAEFRRRNLVSRGEMPYPLAECTPIGGKTACDSGDYQSTLNRCLEEFGWRDKLRLNGKLVEGRYHGLGIGCYIEGGGSGPLEGARLVVESDGSISVYTGSSANGQGLATVFTQIAADALGIPVSRIRGVFHGTTTYVKEGRGSFGSRGTVMGGSAIVTVAKQLLERIRGEAAQRLGCRAEEVRIVDGERAVARGGRSIALGELEGLSEEGTFVNNRRTYSYGAHAAHIAVDAATGCIEIIDYVAVEDVGRIVNPATLHGQTLGAIVQGLSGVLHEGLVYDAEGQLLTGSFLDYSMPVARDFPQLRAFAMEEQPSPNNPLGAKGAGEGGIIPVGGVIANALAAALVSLGVQPRELPLTPSRVWEMIRRSGATA